MIFGDSVQSLNKNLPNLGADGTCPVPVLRNKIGRAGKNLSAQGHEIYVGARFSSQIIVFYQMCSCATLGENETVPWPQKMTCYDAEHLNNFNNI